MARPIEYEIDQVLDSAMTIFCEKGFEATSIRDLVKATGLTSRSLYNVFDSKEGLFKASIEKFRAEKASGLYEMLEEQRGKEALKSLFAMLTPTERGNGCLMVNTLNECNNVNDSCLEVAQNHIRKMERLLTTKLTEAKEDNDFSGDCELTAKLFILVMQGGSVYSRDESNIPYIGPVYTELLNTLGL
ncbi:MAG: hypothetical protein COA42_16030 [Alteromonadaceae bacterium]|nr:MAG: hypothetical protein COA42_16030 [Alteromonadaceae bacterium]